MEKPAFLIQLGDLIERDGKNFVPTLATFENLNFPVFHVLGNHDYEVDLPQKDSLVEILQMPHAYYTFVRKDWRFIVLDGNDLSFYATQAGSSQSVERDSLFEKTKASSLPQAKIWNGGIGQQQLAWMEQTLALAEKKKQRVMVFCHFPIFPESIYNLWNDDEVLSLLKRHPQVVAYLAGHNHQGGYGEYAGIHFLTLKAMVETPEENAFAFMSLYSDSVVIKGYGRESNRVLPLNLRSE